MMPVVRKRKIFTRAAIAVGLISFLPATAAVSRPRGHLGGLDSSKPITIGRSYPLHSSILAGTRRINIYLPDDYSTPGKAFTVLYLLDGGEHEDFLHISALTQISSAYGQGRELIVVGIEGVDRRHDLTSPSKVADDLKAAPTSGGADAYRRFLVGELKPWVERTFKTDGRSAIIGESLAGQFVLETFLKAPGDFDDYIAVSPSLWWNAGGLTDEAPVDLSGARCCQGQRLFIAFETPSPPADAAVRDRARQDDLEAAFKRYSPIGLIWIAERFPEDHAAVYHPAAMAALKWLYGAARTTGN